MGEFLEDFEKFNGKTQFKAVYTVTLGELIEGNLFDWSKPELDWSAAAYDADQYKRVCDYFKERYYYREISIEPYKEWAMILHRRLVYELMPKYRPLYERMAQGFAPLGIEDEYYKRRTIDSKYPETLLSQNADYISDGTDEEWERIKEGEGVERYNAYVLEFHAVDEQLLDELEDMFVCMYTADIQGW